jgi:bidirectional [NiFe] hydrogenase diaphorase subunit
MQTHHPPYSPPTDDKRWRLVNATMRRYGYEPHALIETLHAAQKAFGFLDRTVLLHIAEHLNLPLSRVSGAATFYNYFTLQPEGDHMCTVCMGTACDIGGSPKILEKVKQHIGIDVGETTPDGNVSLRWAHCIGMCWLAPVGVFDDEVVSELDADMAITRIEEWT